MSLGIRILLLLGLGGWLACSSPKERAIEEAIVDLDQKRWTSAVERLEPFRDLPDPRVHYYLGRAWLGQGRWDMAAGAFTHSVGLDSSFADSVVKSYALRAQEISRVDEELGLQLYNRALGFGGLPAEAEIRLADIYYSRGEYLPAVEHYQTGLASGPAQPSGLRARAYERLISSQLKLEDWDGACAAARVGISEGHYALSSLLGEASYNQAWARFRAGDLKGARESVGTLLQLQTPTLLIDDGYYLLGEICLQLEDWDGAISAYQGVLRSDPSFARENIERARDRLRLIQQLRGER